MLNTKECYICMEPCDNLSSCDCKNMYIHKECQLSYIIKKNTKLCSICKKPYTNIVYSENIKKYYTSFFYIKYCLYLSCIIFNLIYIGLCILFVYKCNVLKKCSTLYIMIVSVLSMFDTILIGSVFIYRLYLKRNNIAIIKTIKTPNKLIIV